MSTYNVEIRDYQQKAIDSWIQNEYCGFFVMATGTGKTFTSLYCAKHILQVEGKINLLVLVPTLDLATQWSKDVKKIICNNVILANSKSKNWYEIALAEVHSGGTNSFCIISTYTTFLTGRFQYIVSKLSSKTMLIADEAHNFGSVSHRKLYPQNIKRRLGLSATPERYFDDEGTRDLIDYFNAKDHPTFQFDMADAIREGYLCEYNYYPIIVSLTDSELQEYKKISKKLIKYLSRDGNFKDSNIVTNLLLKRKKIVHNAINKFDVIREIFRDLQELRKPLKFVLVYVPEGNDQNIDIEDYKLINEYSKIISTEFGLKQHQFIGHTKNREKILMDFAEGKIEVLTAMKCLDEGVDVKRAEIAVFCASTGNPRQFIQRRGRVLRTHKDKKNAMIYDMIVVPQITDDNNDKILEMEKGILKGELKRVYEFASLAQNQYQALKKLEKEAKKFDIDIYSKI